MYNLFFPIFRLLAIVTYASGKPTNLWLDNKGRRVGVVEGQSLHGSHRLSLGGWGQTLANQASYYLPNPIAHTQFSASRR